MVKLYVISLFYPKT